jgi:hypothetical protein
VVHSVVLQSLSAGDGSMVSRGGSPHSSRDKHLAPSGTTKGMQSSWAFAPYVPLTFADEETATSRASLSTPPAIAGSVTSYATCTVI